MAEGSWANPLSSFQEMGTLSKALFLLGIIFLTTALFRGATFSDLMLPVSLALISLSLAVHYFSACRPRLDLTAHSVAGTDWGKLSVGMAMSVVTVAMALWAIFITTQKPRLTTSASIEVSKSAETPAKQNDSETKPAPVPKQASPEKIKPSTVKNQISVAGTQAAGDNSAAIGTVTQGPCSVLQNGGSGNTASTECGPTSRRLLLSTKTELVDCLKKKPGRFALGALQGNGEAYRFAQDWFEVFTSAGWQNENKDIPIHIFMIGGGMWSGFQMTVHDASTIQGEMVMAEDSPEKQFGDCVIGRKDVSDGHIIPRKEYPSGSVMLFVSDQIQK